MAIQVNSIGQGTLIDLVGIRISTVKEMSAQTFPHTPLTVPINKKGLIIESLEPLGGLKTSSRLAAFIKPESVSG